MIVDLLENPATITDGTVAPQVFVNLDRRSAKVANATYFTNPTDVTAGTLINRVALYGGGGGDPAISPSQGIFETILKSDEDYLVKFTNNTGGTADTYFNIQFYESGN
jgi:hypothetical protein